MDPANIALQLKKGFLNEHQLEEIEIIESSSDLQITEDDEVWLVQCPKSYDAKHLLNKDINLPGNTKLSTHETEAVRFSNPKSLTFGYKDEKGYSLKNINIAGSVVIRENLETPKTLRIAKTENIPFPENFKERHPLLGSNFNESLNIPEEILLRLEEARNANLQNSLEFLENSIVLVVTDTDDENDITFVRSGILKPKKRKTKDKSKRVEQDSSHKKKKKKSKKSKKDVKDADIDWINYI